MGEVSTPQEQERDQAIARFFNSLAALCDCATELVGVVFDQERKETERPSQILRRAPGKR